MEEDLRNLQDRISIIEDKLIKSCTLGDIQSQLTRLQTDYASMAIAVYDMFFNTVPKDVTLRIYDDNGNLKEVTIPNRAKDATGNVIMCEGDPNTLDISSNQIGMLCMDRTTQSIYYYTNDGWIKFWSNTNFTPNVDYLEPDGSARYLTDINMRNAMRGTALPVASGGTGSTSYVNSFGEEVSGLLKVIPAVMEEGEEVVPSYMTLAKEGIDYAAPRTFIGLICFALTNDRTKIPEGFLICDGSKYPVNSYEGLATYLKNVNEDKYGYTLETDGDGNSYYAFQVPDLRGRYPFFAKPEDEPEQLGEPQLPNITGSWAQEITGAENWFSNAVYVDMEGDKPRQVDGKTSAPGGYYDYLIKFDASKSNPIYNNEADGVRVKDVSLIPIIKY